MSGDHQLTAGIVVAMEAEQKHLLTAASNVQRLPSAVFPTSLLTIGDTRCVIVRSAIGMVHAAAATQFLIGDHHPAIVLNFGCAGAHRRDILPGEVIIGDRCVYHAATQILPDGRERYVGFTSEDGSDIAHVSQFNAVTADPGLVERALAVVQRDGIEPWPGSSESPGVTLGAIASADVWTQSTARLDAIHRRHRTLCEDMEAAAIGRIAHLHQLPFLSVKDISNNEFLRASDLSDFSDFPIEEVGKRAAAVIAGLVRDLSGFDAVAAYSRNSNGLTTITR